MGGSPGRGKIMSERLVEINVEYGIMTFKMVIVLF